jgi:DNA-binding transcriptional LysR family regulator
MNEKQLEAFRAVMIMNSVTAAADLLKVSQPGVSRTIGDLERSLGFKLFLRVKGRLYPTPEGKSFYEELEKSFAGMDRLRRAAEEIREMRRGHLRIAAMPAVSLELLPHAIQGFLALYPDLKITIEVHTSPRIVERVAAQHFDLGVAQFPLEQTGVDIIHSYRTNCVCVAPLGHRFEAVDHITPADLSGETFIALSRHTFAAVYIDRAVEEAGVRRNIRVETQPSYAACAMVAGGVGVALVDPLTAVFFGSNRLVIKPFHPKTMFGFHLMRPDHTVMSRIAKEFVDHASATFLENDLVSNL